MIIPFLSLCERSSEGVCASSMDKLKLMGFDVSKYTCRDDDMI